MKKLSAKDIRTLKRDGVYNTFKNVEVSVDKPKISVPVALAFGLAFHKWQGVSFTINERESSMVLGWVSLGFVVDGSFVQPKKENMKISLEKPLVRPAQKKRK